MIEQRNYQRLTPSKSTVASKTDMYMVNLFALMAERPSEQPKPQQPQNPPNFPFPYPRPIPEPNMGL